MTGTHRNYVHDRAPIVEGLEVRYVVKATQIALTDTVVVSAWKRVPNSTSAGYSTITTDPDFGWLGKVGTGPLPDRVLRFAFGTADREAGIGLHRFTERQLAYSLIEEAYPGIKTAEGVRCSAGDLLVPLETFRGLLARKEATA